MSSIGFPNTPSTNVNIKDCYIVNRFLYKEQYYFLLLRVKNEKERFLGIKRLSYVGDSRFKVDFVQNFGEEDYIDISNLGIIVTIPFLTSLRWCQSR